MIRIGTKAFALALILSAVGAANSFAADTGSDAHHAAAPAEPQAACPTAEETNSLMQQMQSMHKQMAAAKTPAERRALMAEHMRAMQQGMKMMHQMGSSACAAGSTGGTDRMQMHLNMMTMMMQMMMDRQQMGGMGMGQGMGMGTTPNTPKKSPSPPQ